MPFKSRFQPTIRFKLLTGFTVIVLLFILTCAITFYNFQKVNHSYTELIERQSVMLGNVKDIQLLVTLQGNALYSLLLFRDDITRRNMEAVHRQLGERISEVKQLEPLNREIAELDELHKQFKGQIDDIFHGIREDISQGELSAKIATAIPWSKLIKDRSDEMVHSLEEQLGQGIRENQVRSQSVSTFLILFSSFTVILVTLLSGFVIHLITKPISLLTKASRRLETGDLSPLPIHRQDELGELIHLYNHLAEQQRVLIGNMYEQQIRLSRTELKFLQSQINPHFLYNTLDSIYWTAKEHEEEKIGEMAYNLSKFFRLSLQKGKEEFTVEETLEHLNYYIRIQQLRFEDRFSCSIEVDPSCRPLKLVKLLIQPLIENAFIHGLEKRRSGGKLELHVDLQTGPSDEAMLQITVSDNGPGVLPERLKEIQSKLSAIRLLDNGQIGSRVGEQDSSDIFGLSNVKSRLLLAYGSQADLTMDSLKNEGTEVTLWVPVSP